MRKGPLLKLAALGVLPNAIVHLALHLGGATGAALAMLPASLLSWQLLIRFFGLTVQTALFYTLVCGLVSRCVVAPAVLGLLG